MRLEQRGGVAIAFMATVLGIALLIAAWEYLFSRVRTAEAVYAARARATEIAQQCGVLPKLIPTASHRRRLARLRASEL